MVNTDKPVKKSSTPERLTIKSLKDRQDKHEEATASGIAGTHTRIDETQEQLNLKADKAAMEELFSGVRIKLDELERHEGSLGAETIRLRALCTQLERKLGGIDPDSNDTQGQRLDLDEIGRKLGAFAGLDNRLRALREEVDRQGIEQTVIAGEHNKLVGKHNKLTGRVHNAEDDIKMIKAQETPRRFMLLSFTVALIFGVVAGLIWSNTTFQTTIPLTEPLVYDDWRNEPQYPWIAGVGVFALTMVVCFIISLFLRGRAKSPDRATTKENDGELAEPYKAPAIEQNPEPIETSLLGDPATRPYEVAGAGNGTR